MSGSSHDRVCTLIDALQCAPMSPEALAHETDMCRGSVDAWLHALERRGLVEKVGRGPKPETGQPPMLWRWKAVTP